ncbi:MAG: GLPGLI family protein [Bacteroidota bacterium]
MIKLLIQVILLTLPCILNGQSLEVIYKCKNKGNIQTEIKNTENEKIKQALIAAKDIISNYFINFKLSQKGQYSYFAESEDGNDPLTSSEDGKISYTLSARNDIIYKDYNLSQFVAKKHQVSRAYHVEDQFMNFDWQISKEQRKILGFDCIKATSTYCGKEIVAWFTLAIPIQNGPMELGGLPGLILEATNGTGLIYTAQSVRMNVEIENLPYLSSHKKAITHNEFCEEVRKKKGLKIDMNDN